MKYKITLLFFIVMLITILPLSLSSCEGEKDIVGAWEITEIIFDGEKLKDLNPCTFYFHADSTGSKVILGEEEFSFQYSYDGTTCVLYNLTYPDGTVETGTYGKMQVNGNKMTVIATEGDSTETIILRRVIN